MFRFISVFVLLTLAGCNTLSDDFQNSENLARQGDYDGAIGLLASGNDGFGGEEVLKAEQVKIANISKHVLVSLAEKAKSKGDLEAAESFYRKALRVDESFSIAKDGLLSLKRIERQNSILDQAKEAMADGHTVVAYNAVRQVLAESPSNSIALELLSSLRSSRYSKEHSPTRLQSKLSRNISLEFREVSLKDALLVMSNSAGFNFILDQDVPADKKVTLFVTDARLEDVLEYILQTYGLEKKVLNKNTLLIYFSSPEKKAQYADLYTRSFHIANSTPAAVADLLRGILKPADLYVDDYARSVVVRDTSEIIEAAERLIALHDVAPPEVILDVEIVEVTSDLLTNLGMEYPNKISLSVEGADNKAGSVRWSEIKDLNSDSFVLGVGDPLAVLNLKNTLGSGNILAKPQIRVKNREKANILIGDKVPVITSTLNQTSGFESQSVNYLDVGIKLDVEPEIFPGNEVSMKVMLEVSNIAKEIIGENGLRAYQVGTRTASTTLQLKDGETQVLAGLIKNEEINSESRVPGLGAIPGLGKLFSNENNSHKKSELVLLITPRIVRNARFPDSFESEFYSGTKDRFSLTIPELGENASYAAGASAFVSKSDVAVRDLAPSNSLLAAPPSIQTLKASVTAPHPSTQLSLVAPNSVFAGQEFSVPVALDSQYSKALNFSLTTDSANLKFISVAPMVSDQDLSQSLDSTLVKFSLKNSSALRSGDVLAVVRVRALSVDKPLVAALELKPDPSTKGISPSVLGMSQAIHIVPASSSGVAPDSIIPGVIIP